MKYQDWSLRDINSIFTLYLHEHGLAHVYTPQKQLIESNSKKNHFSFSLFILFLNFFFPARKHYGNTSIWHSVCCISLSFKAQVENRIVVENLLHELG